MARRGKSRGKGKSRRSRIAAATPAQLQAINKAIADAEAAGLTSTSGYRGPSHRLTKANPGSQHARARAFDLRAKTPAAAKSVIAAQKAIFDARGLKEGRDYRIINEVTNPSRHATAPHVHVEFTPTGMARYQGTASPEAATNIAADVPTPTARPSLPGDAFTPDVISPEAAAAEPGGLRPGFKTAMGGAAAQGAFQAAVNDLSSGLRPGFTGSAVAPSFSPPGPGTVGGLLGRPSAGLGFMPGSGAMAPTSTGSLRSRSPAPEPPDDRPDTLPDRANVPGARPPQTDDFNRPDLSAFQQPTPGLGGLIGGPRPGQETASFTPKFNESIEATPGLLGQTTATAKPTLPDRAPTPTLADRAMRENFASGLPSLGPPIADRPAAKAVVDAQPASPDDVEAMAYDDETDVVAANTPKPAAVKSNATPKKTGTDAVDVGVDATEENQLDVTALDKTDEKTGYPPAPAPYKPGLFERSKIGPLATAKETLMGGLLGGPMGAVTAGIGGLLSRNLPSGFDAAVPESSRYSVGTGLRGINAALSGPKGATATSLSNPGMSVTSLGNGQSLRRSDNFGWTEVVGPDGSVVGIQYDKPQEKGLLGRISNWGNTKFGGRNGLSPSASRAIAGGYDGGLY